MQQLCTPFFRCPAYFSYWLFFLDFNRKCLSSPPVGLTTGPLSQTSFVDPIHRYNSSQYSRNMVKVKISVLAALLLLAAAVRGSELPPRNSRELMDERELQETDAPSAAPEQPNLAREYTRLT
jgi:hypothetical protein